MIGEGASPTQAETLAGSTGSGHTRIPSRLGLRAGPLRALDSAYCLVQSR